MYIYICVYIYIYIHSDTSRIASTINLPMGASLKCFSLQYGQSTVARKHQALVWPTIWISWLFRLFLCPEGKPFNSQHTENGGRFSATSAKFGPPWEPVFSGDQQVTIPRVPTWRSLVHLGVFIHGVIPKMVVSAWKSLLKWMNMDEFGLGIPH